MFRFVLLGITAKGFDSLPPALVREGTGVDLCGIWSDSFNEEPRSDWVLALTQCELIRLTSALSLKHVQRLGVVVSDLATVALADRYRIDEFSALGIVLVRVVIRKKDAIGTHGKDRAVERLGIEVTACGDPMFSAR